MNWAYGTPMYTVYAQHVLSDDNNYEHLVAPWVSVTPVRNDMLSNGTWCYHCASSVNLQHTHTHTPGYPELMKQPTLLWYPLGHLCPPHVQIHGLCTSLWKTQRDIAATSLMCEGTANFGLTIQPDHVNKSALWTSACACIMDDLAWRPWKILDANRR